MFMTFITLFSLIGLLLVLGISTYEVFQYVNSESQMEKVPVRIRDEHRR